MVTRIQDLVSGNQPLKYQTGAEIAKDVVIDNDTIAADAYGRRLAVKGELYTEITATGLYGPYDRTAADGRQTLARGSAVILAEDADVQLKDKAVGGYAAFCYFDVSELTLNMNRVTSVATLPATLISAFPTCEWDD